MEIINHECYVSFEVAKLLKEAGFNWMSNAIYASVGGEFNFHYGVPNSTNKLKDECSAPTLDVAQSWLREIKNCSVIIDVFVHDLNKNNIYYTYNWIVYLNGDRYSGSDCNIAQYYEVAQEAGIKKALELILEKGE